MSPAQATQLPDLLRVAVGVAPVAMLVADADGRLIAANSGWVELAGATGNWESLFESEARQRMERHLADVAAGRDAPDTIDTLMMTTSGVRWTRWWARREVLQERVVLTLVVVDIDDDVSRTQDLRELATYDHLTGLLNRRFFMESVAQAQRRALRSGSLQALLYVDLDQFKAVNDSGGHAIGDEVLALVAGRLQTAIRGADLCARLGGDEFAILLEDVSGPEWAHAVAERIAASLASPVEVGGQLWPISAAVGVAMAGAGDESPEAWLHRADVAMYANKQTHSPEHSVPPIGSDRAEAGLARGVDPVASADRISSTRPAGSADPAGSGAPVVDVRSDPVRRDGTLDLLRALRDDLARVSESLDQFDSKLRVQGAIF